MDVVVAGGHGKIAMRMLRLLAERGDTGRGLIRNPDHAGELEGVGAKAGIPPRSVCFGSLSLRIGTDMRPTAR